MQGSNESYKNHILNSDFKNLLIIINPYTKKIIRFTIKNGIAAPLMPYIGVSFNNNMTRNIIVIIPKIIFVFV